MRPTLALMICAALATSGCSRIADSRLNPLNWFGSSTLSAPLSNIAEIKPLVAPEARNRIVDGRTLISTINSLEIARTPDGGIVRATGTAPSGAFNAELVPVSQDGGAELAGIRRVVVQAAQNSASSTR